ncbi:glycosyltransferase family 4 protein [Thermosynechococcaceae cyanobacterium BACA0444]|uniref:Glycosyltransferase family 4 protein n=1 Tax=Pseudocalidococcus azoricus BACA0444 TaxID=2918990 RepID=A0AAE4JYW9_9CYAN|nr:glycosyltransferase family 4 protein [Pseudocalidococcus azoricus]MDS3860202.1 glycosyltransferase family 4 protein [Pseudocalidococcus azoricus BACA0444]
MKLLFLSTSVGPLGSGLGGGVELTLLNIAQALVTLGHQITVVAPQGSKLPLPVEMVEISGALQVPAQTQTRDQPIEMPPNPVLGRMWDYARQVQARYDILVNFAYDWLPFYLTPFLQTPMAHLVSMGSLNDVMDQIVGAVVDQFPGSIGVYTRTQAETFPFANQCVALGSGLDLSLYEFCPEPEASLCWLGRISPEKGLEDAVAAVNKTRTPLKIMGQLQDVTYWETIQASYPNAPIQYLGFKTTQEMQEILRKCRALLVTSRWVEAFGNVLIESLACGVPVIAYARGGPTEIIQDGQTGWLVRPDSVPGLIAGIQKLDQISRQACRDQVEQDYALPVYGARVEQWLKNLLL